MPIKLAFSTVACPDWTLDKVAEKACEMGYDGVELRTLGAGGGQLASDPALSDPAKVRAILKAFGVEAACLSTSISTHDKQTGADKTIYYNVLQQLETAAAIGCPAVRVWGIRVAPDEPRNACITRIANRIPALAEKAGELGVQLLFENTDACAKEWWWLLNAINHPMTGMIWNVCNAAAADPNERGGALAVTALNSRIRIAKVKDTKLGQGAGFCQLGDGDVGIELFLKKLRGIGFEGYISVEHDRAWLPALPPAEEYLPEASKRIKAWFAATDAIAAEARVDLAKAANKAAPKPRAAVGVKA